MTTQNPNVDPDDDEVGAFAVPEDVDWETTGFADEDLSGRPAQVKKQAAPRPAQPPVQQPAPQMPARPAAQPPVQQPAPQQPVPQMPARPPVQQPAPQQPAPQQPAPQMPARPAQPPVQQPPAPQMPARPPVQAAPQQPAPPVQQPPAQQPVQQPAPQPSAQQPVYQPPADPVIERPGPAYPDPAAPLPPQQASPTDGGHYSQTPGAGYAPATKATMEDLTAPEWSRIVPTVPDDDGDDDNFSFDGGGFEDPLFPTTPAVVAAPEPERRGGRRAPKPKQDKKRKKEPTAREGKHNAYAGGRWKVKILRGLIFAVLGVLILGGAKNIVTNEEPVSTAELAKRVQAEMGLTGFPTEAAEGFAVRFTREYLTYDEDTIEDRRARLSIYSPAAAEGNWGWNGTGTQSVITGPYVSAPTKVDGKDFGTVTVSAQLSTGEWVALAVPLYASKTGALVIAGPPAFVAQPALAVNPGTETVTDTDDELGSTLAEDVLPGFLTAWATSDQTSLERYITSDATVAARTGLANTVTFGSISEVVFPLGKKTRTGQVKVEWTTAKAGTFSQTYNISVVQGSDGRWSVKDITGGVIDDSTAASTTTPVEGDEVTNGPVQLPEDSATK